MRQGKAEGGIKPSARKGGDIDDFDIRSRTQHLRGFTSTW